MALQIEAGADALNVMTQRHVSTALAPEGQRAHLESVFEAITRSQSRTLYFFRNFLVRYLRYLHMAG